MLFSIIVTVHCASCRSLPLVDGVPDATRETVILIHGMRRTGRSMSKMAASMREAGYNTVICSYSSNRPAHEIATNLFAALGPVIEAAPRVHFVTHSLGGILVRDAFRDGAPPNLGRVVMLGPPNGGSQHIDNFVHLPFFVTIWGAPSPELGTGTNALPARLPPIDFPCLVIAGTNKGLVGWMLPGENDGRVTVASASAGSPSEVLRLPTGHAWMMRNPVVISNTIAFLRAAPPPALAECPAPEIGQPLTDALERIHHCWFEWIALDADGKTNLCYTGYTSDGRDSLFCAIFTNGVLSRAVFSPTNHVVFTDLGSQRDPPDFRIPDVLSATNAVSLDKIMKRPSPENPPRQSVDWGLTAAYMLVRAVCTPISWFTSKPPKPQPLPDADDERLARFNPFSVPLGGSREECERRLGEPLTAPPNAARDALFIYGETPAFSENEKRCVLGVVFRDGRAICVVTLDLLDWDAVVPMLRKGGKDAR